MLMGEEGLTCQVSLVYQAIYFFAAKKSLQELKQLFFRLKDDVFGNAKMFGYGCDTNKLAEILKSYFGEEMKLTDVSEPK